MMEIIILCDQINCVHNQQFALGIRDICIHEKPIITTTFEKGDISKEIRKCHSLFIDTKVQETVKPNWPCSFCSAKTPAEKDYCMNICPINKET